MEILKDYYQREITNLFLIKTSSIIGSIFISLCFIGMMIILFSIVKYYFNIYILPMIISYLNNKNFKKLSKNRTINKLKNTPKEISMDKAKLTSTIITSSLFIVITLAVLIFGFDYKENQGATLNERLETSIHKISEDNRGFGISTDIGYKKYERVEIDLEKMLYAEDTYNLIVYSIGEKGVVLADGEADNKEVADLNKYIKSHGIIVKREYLGEKDYNQIKKYMKELFGEKWQSPYE